MLCKYSAFSFKCMLNVCGYSITLCSKIGKYALVISAGASLHNDSLIFALLNAMFRKSYKSVIINYKTCSSVSILRKVFAYHGRDTPVKSVFKL